MLSFIQRVGIILTGGILVSAQQPATRDVEAVLTQARQEIRDFEKAGGSKADPKHPVEKWAQILWALHEESPGSAQGAKAASEAVHLLVHAGRFDEVYTRADRIPPDDPAWQGLPAVLLEGASLQNDYRHCFEKLKFVASSAPDATVRAAAQLNLGRAWLAQHAEGKAKAEFEAAVQSAPD